MTTLGSPQVERAWLHGDAVVPADPLSLLPRDATVAVALSGGVDSSVAASLLVAGGFSVFGVTLSLWDMAPEVVKDRGCCSVEAADDARRVAHRLGIRHYIWNMKESFERSVVEPFEAEYAAGRTPNPCVHCNQRIKFGELLRAVRQLGATHLATGHYARVGTRGPFSTLHRAADAAKDQSYTLYRLDQEQLSAAVFPLGAMEAKRKVRQLAMASALPVAGKPESQDLCFVADTLSSHLEQRLGMTLGEGDIVDESGRVLGQHQGLYRYTVGQRRRLGPAAVGGTGELFYVLALDMERNQVVVGPRSSLGHRRLALSDCRWTAGVAPAPGTRVGVQLRSHASPVPMLVDSETREQAGVQQMAVWANGPVGRDDGRSSAWGLVQLSSEEPVFGASPGQSAVLYAGDEVLGGGIVGAIGD